MGDDASQAYPRIRRRRADRRVGLGERGGPPLLPRFRADGKVHLVCERSTETHIRALLLQSLGGTGLTPTGLRARREPDDTTSRRAAVAVSGDPAHALEQLITRLSLEPGIRDLHWHLSGGPGEVEAEAVA